MLFETFCSSDMFAVWYTEDAYIYIDIYVMAFSPEATHHVTLMQINPL
jgi:hypothetical protein